MIHAWIYLAIVLSGVDWGFFGHKLINRVAVYTLPTEMIGWYKPYIDYLSDHAVDPDKRRYANKFEAVRHYIDLDHWGKLPFEHMPRYWDEALSINLDVYQVNGNDTVFLLKAIPHEMWGDSISDRKGRLDLVRDHYLRQYYDDVATISCDSLNLIFPEIKCKGGGIIYMEDVLSEHGIVPYHLQAMQ